MIEIKVNANETVGKIKPMNAVNNGPVPALPADDQLKENFSTYKAARIPYARNHDAAFCSSYGSCHTVDVDNIFPDFDADPEDPASYDFVLTDFYTQSTLDAGTETFYRLGARIEHECKKYHTLPPKDFKKWAVVCEHIIRHLNYGWANGHHFGITYWEIWNEPDLDTDDCPNKRTWGGTKAQFFDLFEVTAKHLKSCFPELKIGGPAIAGWIEWGDEFLAAMHKRNVPMDFFSWHIYTSHSQSFVKRANEVSAILKKNGYEGIESICNEWNYIYNKDGWTKNFVYSLKQIVNQKGAALVADVITRAQKETDVAMMMYYDARPSGFNGMFDGTTFEPLKGYYPIYYWSDLAELGTEVKTTVSDDKVSAVAAVNGKGEMGLLFTYYQPDDGEVDFLNVEVKVEGLDAKPVWATVTNANVTDQMIHFGKDDPLKFKMLPNSFVFIKF